MNSTTMDKRRCSPLTYETTLEGFGDVADGSFSMLTVGVMCLLFMIIGAGLGYKYGMHKGQAFSR